MKKVLGVLAVGLMSTAAVAAPTVDGSIMGDGYGFNAVQQVQTQFGDNQSELNAAYSRVEGGRLYVALTGNIEANFNKLDIFFDTVGIFGQNQIGGQNPTNDGWADKFTGYTFDSGFTADYMMIVRRGNDGTDKFDVDFARVGGTDQDYASYFNVFNDSLEGSASLSAGDRDFGDRVLDTIEVGYNDSNVAGVLGGTEAADQSAAMMVQTGLEFSVSLADLGNPANPTDISISAMVNNGGHDYLSNQFLGALTPPQGNLGSDGTGAGLGNLSTLNMNNLPGDQFFIVPEPGTFVLLALGGLGLVRRRR